MREGAEHRARVFNLGCGPAREVQAFIAEYDICDRCSLSLLDFNQETLEHVSGVLDSERTTRHRSTTIRYLHRSVNDVLRKGMHPESETDRGPYDMVYCAGLFDYLSDRICRRLISIFYEALAPGGLLLVTNVDAGNPIRRIMEYLLEWHLVYRSQDQLAELAPSQVKAEDMTVYADESGANIFLEIRRPRE